MQAGTPMTVTPSGREFCIPVGLLKTFKNDVRRLPEIPHNNGYIIFDREMLISVLRGDDVKMRMEVANQLEKMGKVGGELLIVQG